MKDNKQLIFNIILQTISYGLNYGISFFLSPYIINSVGATSYGFVTLANNITGYVSIITIALTSVSARFVSIAYYRGDIKKACTYFSSILITNIIISLCAVFPLGYLVLNVDQLLSVPTSITRNVQILFTLIFAAFMIGLISNSYSIGTFIKNRLDISSIRDMVGSVIKAVILICLFIFLEPNIIYLGIATFIVAIYTFAINLSITKKLVPQLKLKLRYYDKKSIFEVLSSGIWSSISKLGGVLSNGLDLLIANLFISASAMGIMSVSKTIPSILSSVILMVSSCFLPLLTRAYAKNDRNELLKILKKSINLLNLLCVMALSFLIVFGDTFFYLWVPAVDNEKVQILSVISCLQFCFTLSLQGLWDIFILTNKLKISSLVTIIFSSISLLTVFIILDASQPEMFKLCIIAGMSTIFGIIKSTIFLPVYGAKILGLKWNSFYLTILRGLLNYVFVILVLFLFKKIYNPNSWFTLVISGICTCIVSLMLWLLIVCGRRERKTYIKQIKLLILKKEEDNV